MTFERRKTTSFFNYLISCIYFLIFSPSYFPSLTRLLFLFYLCFTEAFISNCLHKKKYFFFWNLICRIFYFQFLFWIVTAKVIVVISLSPLWPTMGREWPARLWANFFLSLWRYRKKDPQYWVLLPYNTDRIWWWTNSQWCLWSTPRWIATYYKLQSTVGCWWCQNKKATSYFARTKRFDSVWYSSRK